MKFKPKFVSRFIAALKSVPGFWPGYDNDPNRRAYIIKTQTTHAFIQFSKYTENNRCSLVVNSAGEIGIYDLYISDIEQFFMQVKQILEARQSTSADLGEKTDE